MKTGIALFSLIFFWAQTIYAQKDRAELIFKDGTKIEGLANLKSSDNIRFRKKRKAQRQVYTFNEVDTLKIYEKDEIKTYVQVAIKDKDEPKVLELVNSGKNLFYYRDVFTSYGGGAMMPGTGFNMSAGGGFYYVTNSYVRKPGQDEATYLASTNWLSKNFKKAASEYFSDCPHLVSKIQNRELKKKHLKEIITYYNTECE